MRRIGVITCARSEYSNCLPILRALKAEPELQTHLIVSGMHLSPEFGYTVREIEADGFEIGDRIEMLLSSDTPEGAAKSLGLGVIGFGQSFGRCRPDILLLLGDRTELLAAACAALPFLIPMAHAFGGDVTEGAIDNQVRHALTKLSHLHFVAMQEHADRVIQMGEEPWRVTVSGDPAVDTIKEMKPLTRTELAEFLALELTPPLLVVTFHPTTLAATHTVEEIDQLLEALERIRGSIVFTYPNSDANSRAIISRIREFAASRAGVGVYQNLGQQRYYSLLFHADLMVGNSSSGLWEAPSFHLPVINIGDRQRGRLRVANVIDVPCEAQEIHRAILRGLDPAFRESLRDVCNPYGTGDSAARILRVLKQVEIGPRLLQKRFAGKGGDQTGRYESG